MICSYCKAKCEGRYGFEDHCLLACPQKCRDYEEAMVERDLLRKALEMAAKDVRRYGKFSEPGEIDNVIPRDGNWYLNEVKKRSRKKKRGTDVQL